MSDSENNGESGSGSLETLVRTAELQGETKDSDAGEAIPTSEYGAGPKGVEYRTNKYSKGSDDNSPDHKQIQRKITNHSGIAALLAEDANENNGKITSRKLLAEYSLGEESSLSDRLASKGDEKKHHELPNAALVKIYYEDSETGKKWGYFERKPFYYSYAGAENKLALVGGSMELGETPYETVCREIEEEISPEAARIIINSIDPNIRFVAVEHYDGVPINNFVFEAKIRTREEWEKLVASNMTADAGHKVIMPLEEISATKEQWAFYHYDIEMKFQRDLLHHPTEWTKSSGIYFRESYTLLKSLNLPGVYNDSTLIQAMPSLTIGFKPEIYADSLIKANSNKPIFSSF